MAYYLIRHTKGDEIKFAGHLDLTKAIQRIIDRADLDIEYSQGFNPHMILSSAQPVPVGQLSRAEYIMGDFTTTKTPEEILTDLNEVAPEGVEFLFVKRLENDKRTPMGALAAISYEIVIPGGEDLLNEIQRLLLKDRWNLRTVSKKGVPREEDIRGKVKSVSIDLIRGKEDAVHMEVLLASGSKEHLSTDHFLQYIKENTENFPVDRFIRVTREEMYIETDGLRSMEEL